MWRHRFGRGFGPVVRENTEWMNEMRRPRLTQGCRAEKMDGWTLIYIYTHLFGILEELF